MTVRSSFLAHDLRLSLAASLFFQAHQRLDDSLLCGHSSLSASASPMSRTDRFLLRAVAGEADFSTAAWDARLVLTDGSFLAESFLTDLCKLGRLNAPVVPHSREFLADITFSSRRTCFVYVVHCRQKT